MSVDGEWIVVEKRKWDGRVSARWPARLVSRPPAWWAWVAPAGTRRERPWRDEVEVLAHEERGTSAPGTWWLATEIIDADGRRERWEIDAATPVEAGDDGVVRFVDLDLDLDIPCDADPVELQDVAQFLVRAREMGYPGRVIRGAVAGLRDAAARHRRGDRPFDRVREPDPRR